MLCQAPNPGTHKEPPGERERRCFKPDFPQAYPPPGLSGALKPQKPPSPVLIGRKGNPVHSKTTEACESSSSSNHTFQPRPDGCHTKAGNRAFISINISYPFQGRGPPTAKRGEILDVGSALRWRCGHERLYYDSSTYIHTRWVGGRIWAYKQETLLEVSLRQLC